MGFGEKARIKYMIHLTLLARLCSHTENTNVFYEVKENLKILTIK